MKVGWKKERSVEEGREGGRIIGGRKKVLGEKEGRERGRQKREGCLKIGKV